LYTHPIGSGTQESRCGKVEVVHTSWLVFTWLALEPSKTSRCAHREREDLNQKVRPLETGVPLVEGIRLSVSHT
jgi:hypothetical protein